MHIIRVTRFYQVIIYCRSGRRSGIVSKYAAEELGFNDIYNIVGGLNQWTDDRLPLKTHANDHSPWVHTIFEHETATAQYIVTDIGKSKLKSTWINSIIVTTFNNSEQGNLYH